MFSALTSGITFNKNIFPALLKFPVIPTGVLNLWLYTSVKYNSFWSLVLESKQVKGGEKTPNENHESSVS